MKGRYFGGEHSGLNITAMVDGDVLHLSGSDFEGTFDLTKAEVSVGGDQGTYIVCKVQTEDGEQVLYLERSGLLAALEAGRAPQRFVEQIRGSVSTHRKRWLKTRTVILGVLALVVVVCGWIFARLETLAIDSVPPELEQELGRSAWEDHRKTVEIVDDPRLNGFVQALGTQLVQQRSDAPYEFEFYVVKDDTPNAFALPGGVLAVHTGLIAKAENAEEVAGVLGHEIAHVLLRHGLRQSFKSLGTVALITIVIGDITAIGLLGAGLINLTYSRDHETEADELGARLLHEVGVDPLNVGRILERISKEHGGEPPEIISTHPGGENRREHVEELKANLPSKEYGSLEWEGASWETIQEICRGELPLQDAEGNEIAEPKEDEKSKVKPATTRSPKQELIGAR